MHTYGDVSIDVPNLRTPLRVPLRANRVCAPGGRGLALPDRWNGPYRDQLRELHLLALALLLLLNLADVRVAIAVVGTLVEVCAVLEPGLVV